MRTTCSTLAPALLALLVARAAHADPTQLLLQDGQILTGDVLDVEVGVRVRVRLEDGQVRELRWSEVRSVPYSANVPVTAVVSAGPAAASTEIATSLVTLEAT